MRGCDRVPRRRRLAWVLALACVASPALAELAPLYVVPTESRRRDAATDEQVLRLEFEAVDRERLLAVLGPAAIPSGPTTVRLDLPHRTEKRYDEDRPGQWLDATFLVDHDQPAVVALRDELRASRPGGRDIDVGALVDYVGARIEAVHGQGWEPASVTARSLRGDCTEHAVLTVALARSVGIPARVVVGMVIVPTGTQYAALGHAWAELRDGDHWTVADAALGPLSERARYVTLGLLEDESTGFLLPLFGTLTAWVSRVVVLEG
jgi:transglutaminase-like putative cysteine protease